MSKSENKVKRPINKWQIRIGIFLFVSIMMFPPLTGTYEGKSFSNREFFVWNDQFAFDLWDWHPLFKESANIDWGWIAFCMVWYAILSSFIIRLYGVFPKESQDQKLGERSHPPS